MAPVLTWKWACFVGPPKWGFIICGSYKKTWSTPHPQRYTWRRWSKEGGGRAAANEADEAATSDKVAATAKQKGGIQEADETAKQEGGIQEADDRLGNEEHREREPTVRDNAEDRADDSWGVVDHGRVVM